MRGVAVLMLGLLLLPQTVAQAALGTFDAANLGMWKEGGASVIIATVQDVKELNGLFSEGTHTAVLMPHATIAGGFDPGLHPTLNVHFWVGSFGTSIWKAPSKGELIMAVIQSPDELGGHKGYIIESAICPFMPFEDDRLHPIGSPSVTVITGLNDPKVTQALWRIQVARLGHAALHPQPATAAATTQPMQPRVIASSSDLKAIAAPADGMYRLVSAKIGMIAEEPLLKGDLIGFRQDLRERLVGLVRSEMSGLALKKEDGPYEWRLVYVVRREAKE